MRIFLLGSLLIMTAAAAMAPASPAIMLRGNLFMSRAGIIGLIGIPDRENLPDGLQHVLDGYRIAGYLDAGARADWSEDSAGVTISISEGRRYKAGLPSFNGNAYLSGRYLAGVLALGPGSYFEQRLLAADLRRISRAYAAAGFPHARVQLSELALHGDTVCYGYDINEGPLVTLTGVRFSGNVLTTDRTARRLSGLATGGRFDANEIDRAVSRLLRSGLFTDAALAGVATSGGTAVFVVREPRYNNLSGALGYNQGARQAGWLAGSADLELRNIAGTARQFSFHWERLREFTSGLRASYREPWVLGSPLGALLAIRHAIQDSLFVQTGGEVLFTVPLGDQLTVGAGGSAERTVPGSQLAVRRSLRYSSLWTVQGDHRALLQGSPGWKYRLQLEYGRKRYYSPEAQLTVGRIELDGQWSRPLSGKQAINLAIHGRALASSEHPAPRTDQYFLGGAGTVRGFFEQQFTASQLAWFNAEYRLAAAAGFELYPFLDCGYLRDRDRDLDRFRAGYGIGMRLDTRLGRIQIDYGLGQGDSPSAGKVHLILRSDF